MPDPSPVALTRDEAEALTVVLEQIRIEGPAGEVKYDALESAKAKLRAVASGGSPPSLPAEPSKEAIKAAYDAYFAPHSKGWKQKFGDTAAMLDALRAAYRIDSSGGQDG